MKLHAIASAAVLCALSVGSAHAATMTFTGIPDGEFGLAEPHQVWTEDGITATSPHGDIASFQNPNTAHMDPPGWTTWASTITFTMAGYFDPFSLDIIGGSSTNYCTWEPDVCNVPYDNVRIAGYRDGFLIAEDIFFAGDMTSVTYLFANSFMNLDELFISALNIPNWDIGDCISECSHFDIDNVTLFDTPTPVPLPAALPLFLLGLAGLGLLRWVRA